MKRLIERSFTFMRRNTLKISKNYLIDLQEERDELRITFVYIYIIWDKIWNQTTKNKIKK